MNSYLILCRETRSCAIVDPGADAGKLLELASGNNVEMILVTHGHPDHIGALHDLKTNTNAPVHINPKEAHDFNLDYDHPIEDKERICLGNVLITPIHTPGHTHGMTSFDIGDNRILVGDTVFVGGPGKTWSPEDFAIQMRTMQEIVFKWSDDTEFYPGHGPMGMIGDERPAFEAFLERGWQDDLYGDVTWV
jgi:glyoxylase-like metal-dependent hydrolase (beta-lactamase superfamily II)